MDDITETGRNLSDVFRGEEQAAVKGHQKRKPFQPEPKKYKNTATGVTIGGGLGRKQETALDRLRDGWGRMTVAERKKAIEAAGVPLSQAREYFETGGSQRIQSTYGTRPGESKP